MKNTEQPTPSNTSEKLEDFKGALIDYSFQQRRAIVALSVTALAIAAFFFFSSKGEAVEIPSVKVVEQSPQKMFLVHVAGDVKNPGVYPVIEGSRVVDALAAAGGAKKGVDLSQINLARKVVDGEQIYLGKKKAEPRSSKGKNFTGIIYVNRATAAQFDSLTGIGPVIAKRIVDYRNANGPFVDIADLQKVSGIGVKNFERIKGRLSL